MKVCSIIIMGGLILLASACFLFNEDNSVDLGENYRYLPGPPSRIIYHTSNQYNGVGFNALPPLVTSYTVNDNYILAQSKDLKDNETTYWIINKLKDREIERVDSSAYFIFLKEHNLE